MAIQKRAVNTITIGEAKERFLDYQFSKGLSDASIGMSRDAIDGFLKRSKTSEKLLVSIITEDFVQR